MVVVVLVEEAVVEVGGDDDSDQIYRERCVCVGGLVCVSLGARKSVCVCGCVCRM